MKNIKSIHPASTGWLTVDNICVARYFDGLGFNSLQEVLDMRVFDLMNMNRLDAIRVEEIITCLYQFLNPNTAEDEAMNIGAMSQHFDYSAWRKVHKDLSQVTVEDLVFTEDINLKAIQHFYNAIRKKFFKSDEYSWKSYKFRDKKEYLAALRKRNKEVHDDKN